MLKHSTIFAALLGLTLIFITPSPAIAIDNCAGHSHTGTGRGVSKSMAELSARQKWRSVVATHLHPDKISWMASQEQSTTCWSKYYGYKCKARAVPCLSTIVKTPEDIQEDLRNLKQVPGLLYDGLGFILLELNRRLSSFSQPVTDPNGISYDEYLENLELAIIAVIL